MRLLINRNLYPRCASRIPACVFKREAAPVDGETYRVDARSRTWLASRIPQYSQRAAATDEVGMTVSRDYAAVLRSAGIFVLGGAYPIVIGCKPTWTWTQSPLRARTDVPVTLDFPAGIQIRFPSNP